MGTTTRIHADIEKTVAMQGQVSLGAAQYPIANLLEDIAAAIRRGEVDVTLDRGGRGSHRCSEVTSLELCVSSPSRRAPMPTEAPGDGSIPKSEGLEPFGPFIVLEGSLLNGDVRPPTIHFAPTTADAHCIIEKLHEASGEPVSVWRAQRFVVEKAPRARLLDD